MNATIERSGKVRQNDGKAEPRAIITEVDVQKPTILVRLLRALLESVSALERQKPLRRITRPPQAFLGDGTTKYRLFHDLGVIPDVLVVRWEGVAPPNFQVHESSTTRTLVLVSLSEGVGTLRLEAE